MIQKQEATKRGIKILDSNKPCNALLENLKANFPQTIKDGQVDLKAIALLLGLSDKANIQGYELTFTGKGLANALYTTPCQKALKHKETFCHSESALAGEESQKQSHEVQTLKSVVGVEGEFEREEGATSQFKPLRPLIKENSNNKEISAFSNLGNATQNTLIIGDNLDALKILKSAYSEKIKMIYIDPPYNTRNDDFIYPDDFRADYQAILREVGLLEIDENGQEVESETLQFFRNITGSKTHSGWLCFMLPRLKLARDLLKEDGVIFISIDDNEQANLKLLCDEIFGEENFVANIIWRKRAGGGNDSKHIAVEQDYILSYAKNIDLLVTNGIERTNLKQYKQDDKGYYIEKPLNDTALQDSAGLHYDIQLPNGKILKGDKHQWKMAESTFLTRLERNEIIFKSNDKVYYKHYVDIDSNLVPPSIFYNLTLNADATKEIKELFGDKIFDTPKPTKLIRHLLNFAVIPNLNNEPDIILDFFAGSGTTAQAVMELNAEDGGNRECILVQLDEPIKEEKSKVAYDFCKNELGSENPTISDITIERVKRAAKKINANMCLNIFTLESKPKLISDEKGTLALTTNTNLSALDKAINLALSAGKTLNQTLQVVLEGKLYKCEDSYFCIECDKAVLETLAKTSDEYIYLDGFADIDLEHFLNLDAQFKERLNIVY